MLEPGWYGVDLDGTLAYYEPGQYPQIGAPIPLMIERVKGWLKEGKEVRIVTARVSGQDMDEIYAQVELIGAWCRVNIGQELEVTNEKDFDMIELWDDRAVAVERNTGRAASWNPSYDFPISLQ